MAKKKAATIAPQGNILAAAGRLSHLAATGSKDPGRNGLPGTTGLASSTVIGLNIPIPMQYVFGAGVLPLGVVMEVNGERQSCKSMFCFELGRMFAEAGGWLEFLVTEGKLSRELAHSIIGWSPERLDAFHGTMTSDMKVWQSTLLNLITHHTKMINSGNAEFDIPPGATFPVMYCVDSIMGANLPETNKRIEETGFAGRAFAAEALSLTTYLKTVANAVMAFPFLVVMINHLKIDKDPNQPYSEGTKRTPGGRQLKFQETFELSLSRIKSEQGLDQVKGNGLEINRRLIKMQMAKNSIGTDGRSASVWVSWQKREIAGRQVQFTKWDWDEATARMLIDFHAGKLSKIKLSESTMTKRLDEFFHIRKRGKFYISDTLGITAADQMSGAKMGRLINETPEAVAAIRHAFGIPNHNLWIPGTDYVAQRTELEAQAKVEDEKWADDMRSMAISSDVEGLDVDDAEEFE
jgi:RecA/RadA recombinase